jgi:hypothetical protein
MKLPFVSYPTLRSLGRLLNGRVLKGDDVERLTELKADINQLEYETASADLATEEARKDAPA